VEVNNALTEALIKLHQHTVNLCSELAVETREGKRYQLQKQIEATSFVAARLLLLIT
jgi:hypothetical protein